MADLTGATALLDMFDDVYSYNDAVAPQHPSIWQPRDIDLPIWERGLRSLWSLEGELHLVLANLHLEPALIVAQAFADATIDVYVDGLMGYGPTRSAIPPQVGTRVQRVLHPDLVPGVRPLLLRDFAAEPVPIATESSARCWRRSGSRPNRRTWPGPRGRPRFSWRQDLTAPSLLTKDEERRLHLEMVEATVAAGYADLVFKLPPSGPAGPTGSLVRRADELGARLTVREEPELVETWYAAGAVDLVVSCFCTALVTAGWYERAGGPGRHRDVVGATETVRDRQPDGGRPGCGYGAPAEQPGGAGRTSAAIGGSADPTARRHRRLPDAAQPQRRPACAGPPGAGAALRRGAALPAAGAAGAAGSAHRSTGRPWARTGRPDPQGRAPSLAASVVSH